MARTPLMNVPIKAEVRSGIRPLSLSKLSSSARLPERKELTRSSATAPDPRDHNDNATLQNVIVRRTEPNKLKDRIKELEEENGAISTSYSILCQDVKEVKAKNQDLGKRVNELEAQVVAEHRNGLEYVRRELLLGAENEGLKSLLSKKGDRISGDDNVIMDGGSNEK
jgi:septal ring factor EnvC (AmiA/AmiB activator)